MQEALALKLLAKRATSALTVIAYLTLAKLRIYLTMAAIVIYCSLFNLYIYELVKPYMTLFSCRISYNCITVGFHLFFLFDWKAGYVNYLHNRLNLACIWILICQYFLVILNYLGVHDMVTLFIAFNTSIAISATVLAVNYFKTTWKH